jgi:hypothetical protein
MQLSATCRLELLGPQGTSIGFGHGVRAEGPSQTSREYALNSVAELARRAKEAGQLRPDFVLDDLILMIMANDGIPATSPATRVAASRRFAALATQAFQASPPSAAAS